MTPARFSRKKPLGAAGGLVMLLDRVKAAVAEVLATHDPIMTEAAGTLGRPSWEHWLGADHLGRDIYSRIVHGARVSLIVGVASTLLGSVLGGIVGLLSGYVGGKTDLIVQRVLDILQGLPLLVLALVISAVLSPSIQNVVIVSVPIIPRAARVIRSSVLSIREMQYVEAARALGVAHLRIAFRHILPNTMGPFIVLGTAQLGSAILVEATLSFLGLGVPEPYPSWGRMLSVSAAEYAQKAPHLVLFPGLAISLAVFGSNLLGDALRDTLDPRLARRRTVRVGPLPGGRGRGDGGRRRPPAESRGQGSRRRGISEAALGRRRRIAEASRGVTAGGDGRAGGSRVTAGMKETVPAGAGGLRRVRRVKDLMVG